MNILQMFHQNIGARPSMDFLAGAIKTMDISNKPGF